MSKQLIEQNLLANTDLSGVCNTYFRLDALINSGGESEQSVSSVLDEDQHYVKQRLLKLVNSGLYPSSSILTTVADVVRLVGHTQVRDLVLSISMIEVLKRLSPDIVSRESFWKHSIATAVASATLAGYINADRIARYFLAGLLHDVGSLLMYSQIPEKALMKILKDRHSSGALYELESKEVGYNHAEVGGALAASLKLPLWLEESIAYHHAPMQAPHHSVEAAAVHVADIVVNAMRYGSRGEFLVPPLADGAWESLKLSVTILDAVMQKIDSLTPTVFLALLDEK